MGDLMKINKIYKGYDLLLQLKQKFNNSSLKPLTNIENININGDLQVLQKKLRPKLKIYFVSPYPSNPEKKVLPQKMYFNFQSRLIFFNFIANLERTAQSLAM